MEEYKGESRSLTAREKFGVIQGTLEHTMSNHPNKTGQNWSTWHTLCTILTAAASTAAAIALLNQ